MNNMITIRLDKETIKEIDLIIKKYNLTRSVYIRGAIKTYNMIMITENPLDILERLEFNLKDAKQIKKRKKENTIERLINEIERIKYEIDNLEKE